MSTGVCLVATTGGALPEVTGRDGETVLSCAPADADALAAAIRRGLDDDALRARIGAAGRQRVVERWSWRHCASLTVEQYREVLQMPHNVEKLRKRLAAAGGGTSSRSADPSAQHDTTSSTHDHSAR